MIKQIILFLLLLILLVLSILLITSCAKVTSVETDTVEATIIDANYTPTRMIPMRTGKITTHITYPSRHEITVKYGDISTTIDDRNLYYKYKDHIGSIVECELITKYFDNGKIRQELKIKK